MKVKWQNNSFGHICERFCKSKRSKPIISAFPFGVPKRRLANVHLQILLFNTHCTLHDLAFETNVLLGSTKSHIQTTFTMPHSYVEVTGNKDLGRKLSSFSLIKPNQMFLSVEYWWKCEASRIAPASNMLDFNGDNAGVEGQEKLWRVILPHLLCTGHLCADSLSPLFYGTCHFVGKYQYELFGLNKNTDGWIIQRKNMERPRFKAGMGRNNFLARGQKEPEGYSDYS